MFYYASKVFAPVCKASLRDSGVVFSTLVLFAALASSISLMETVVSIVQDKFHMKKESEACLRSMVLPGDGNSFFSGLLACFPGWLLWGFSILDFFDFPEQQCAYACGGVITCIFVWVLIVK